MEWLLQMTKKAKVRKDKGQDTAPESQGLKGVCSERS